MKYNGTLIRPARHVALVNTSVDDCRSSLSGYNSPADLEIVRKAVKLELAKGRHARATMVQLLKNKICQLEKRQLESIKRVEKANK